MTVLPDDAREWLANYEGGTIMPGSLPASMPPEFVNDFTTPGRSGFPGSRRIWLTEAGVAAAKAARTGDSDPAL